MKQKRKRDRRPWASRRRKLDKSTRPSTGKATIGEPSPGGQPNGDGRLAEALNAAQREAAQWPRLAQELNAAQHDLSIARGLLPPWWRRELAHVAGGYAGAALVLHAGAPWWAALVAGVLPATRELWDRRRGQSKLKTIVDVAAWVAGSGAAVWIGL